MADDRFRVIDPGRLMLGEEELLAGPLPELDSMCRILNACDPPDENVVLLLRALIAGTRDCSFGPGTRLLSDGTPLKMLGKGKP
jgi:hypothetical protein